MRVTHEPALRDFWYPVLPMLTLRDGPQAFRLLGEDLVLWLDEAEAPCAAVDRCPHRSARLSTGRAEHGLVTCRYHGWAFARDGRLARFPQSGGREPPARCKLRAFHCREAYGHVWVCLGEPACDVPEVPEALDPRYRRVDIACEPWATSSLRVIENEVDMAHFAFVHRGTFGDPDTPNPLALELIDEGPFSLRVRATISVRPIPQQRHNIGLRDAERSTRDMDIRWQGPFFLRIAMHYPTGLHHVIINHPTPIDDEHIQVVQFHYRSDTEADARAESVVAMERRIITEDRVALEACDPIVPLDLHEELHMPTDRAGILVRKKLAALLRRDGEGRAAPPRDGQVKPALEHTR